MKLGLAVAALLAASGAAAGPFDAARGVKILAEARAACGGSAWDRIAGWHERGRLAAAGKPDSSYEGWSAVTRPAMAIRTAAFSAGYDAETYWRTAPTGIAAGSDPAALRISRRDAYLSNFGYLQPARFPAAVDDIGPRTVGATVYDVVRVVPVAAQPAELWLDRASHRVVRIVAGAQASELRDYKTVAGVCGATTAVQTDGNPAHTTTVHVESVDTAEIDKSVFAPPVR